MYKVGEKLRSSTGDIKYIVGLEPDVKYFTMLQGKVWDEDYSSFEEAMAAITKDIKTNYKWTCTIKVLFGENTEKGIPFGFKNSSELTW